MPGGFPQLARRENEAAEQKRCGARRNREGSRAHRPPPRTKPGTPDFCVLSFFFLAVKDVALSRPGFSHCKVWKEGASAESRASRALGSPKLSRDPGERERKGTTRQPQRASPLKLILPHGPEKERSAPFCRSPYLRQLSFARSLPAEYRERRSSFPTAAQAETPKLFLKIGSRRTAGGVSFGVNGAGRGRVGKGRPPARRRPLATPAAAALKVVKLGGPEPGSSPRKAVDEERSRGTASPPLKRLPLQWPQLLS